MAAHCHCGEPSPDSGGNCLERDDGISSVARTTPTPWLCSLPVHFGLIGLPLRAFQYVLLRDAFLCLISWLISDTDQCHPVSLAGAFRSGSYHRWNRVGGAHALLLRHAPGPQCQAAWCRWWVNTFAQCSDGVWSVRLAGNGQVSSYWSCER